MKKRLDKRACKCGSSDGLQPYLDTDTEKVDGWCFVCQTYFRNLDEETKTNESYQCKSRQFLTKEEINLTYPIRGISDRLVSEEINRRYGVRVSVNEMTGEFDTVYYPYQIGAALSGYKVRGLPKDFKPSIGSTKGADLFGWHLVDFNSKKLIITEGEEDTLAICQALWQKFGCKSFPNVVSLADGANITKKFEKIAKKLQLFDQVIVCFDNDEEGQKALSSLSLLVDSRKLHILKLSEHDASDALKAGKSEEIVNAFLQPDIYQSKRVSKLSEFKDEFFDDSRVHSALYPKGWVMFNSLTEGLKLGDLDIFTGASSNGKTQLFREIVFNLLSTTEDNIGCLFLEETRQTTMYGIGGLKISKRATVPSIRGNLSSAEKQKMWEFLTDKDRIFLKKDSINFNEDMSDNEIFEAVHYMITNEGCKYIIIDHLDMIPSSGERNNVNVRTEEIVRKLKNFAVSGNVWIGLAAHLRKGDSKATPFDRGGLISQEDLKGASGIFQRADSLFYLQRNRYHSDPVMQNISRLHVVKARTMATCGEGDFLQYSAETGRMLAISPPGTSIIEPVKKQKGATHVYDDF
jgi:twinkle protein